jgi:hypothetical protein
MYSLENTIMSDNSRLFAKIENRSLSENLIQEMQHKRKLKLVSKKNKRYTWADFRYKNQEFSIFSGTGDLMLFADNYKCSDKILQEVLGFVEY